MNKEERFHTRKMLYAQLINKKGVFVQSLKTVEEMAELTQLIVKHLSGEKIDMNHLMEEFVDVQIMLEQFKLMYSMDNTTLSNLIDEKLSRIESLIGGEK